MSDNKKYYYLKLKDRFYDTEDIKILESMPNGYEYSSLYLKLCLLSLKDEGRLLYKNRIPYSPEMLSTITGHNIDTIRAAIPIFKELEMLKILDNGAIFIDDIQDLVGKSSSEAERKAKYRKRIEIEQVGQIEDKCPPEKEKEKEIEKEALDLSEYFIENYPVDIKPTRWNTNKPSVEKYAVHIQKLNKDGFDYDYIRKIIDWTFKDQFWRKNIQCTSTLRKQIDKLEVKYKSENKTKPSSNLDWMKYY